MTTAQSLRRVTAAATKDYAARAALEDAIRTARTSGATLRAIAAAANLSPENVRRITRKRPQDMTTEEAMRELFPAQVVREMKKEANR